MPHRHTTHNKQTLVWARKGAEDGDALAQFNYAAMCAIGQGVGKDSLKVAKWFEKAAEQGHADAQFNLAKMYARGEGVPRNDELAYFWVLLAREKLRAMTHVHDEPVSRLSADQRAAIQLKAGNWQPKTPVTPTA
jgi:TPR repeat protein